MGFFSNLFGGKKEPEPAKPAETPASQNSGDEDEDWENAGGVPQELAVMEVQALFESENPPVFLDVREDHERQADGYIPGSVHIPSGEIASRCDELSREKPIIIYCASGMRSMDAGAFLMEKGFQDVSNMAGGITVWQGPREKPGGS